MFNRRKSKRLEIAVPLHFKLLGLAKDPPTIETVTRNISPLGVSTELHVTLTNGVFFILEGEKPVNLIPFLVLEKKEIEVAITIPPRKKKVRARGKIIWYDFGSREASYYFEAGIFLEEMEVEDRKMWEEFVRNTMLKTGKLWQHMQIVSSFTFIAGIIIFIVGLGVKLATTAKIGVFLSFIGLIGFIMAWWQHRSFMLLKKFKFL
jgi:hypothetical protein